MHSWPTSTWWRTSLRGSVADFISSVWKAPLTGRGLVLMNWSCLEFFWRKSSAWGNNTEHSNCHDWDLKINCKLVRLFSWQIYTELYHCNRDKRTRSWSALTSLLILLELYYPKNPFLDWLRLRLSWFLPWQKRPHTCWCPAMTLPSGNR